MSTCLTAIREPNPRATVTPVSEEFRGAAPRVIRDSEFARRLEKACEAHPHAPDKHRGQLRWLQEQMLKMGVKVSAETARKWLSGEARPRPSKMMKLAQALSVDPAWLSMGIDPELEPRERKARNAMADGAVNLVAGVIQMDGGYPAFPEESDKRAQADHVDLYAIIHGANYSLHVSLAEKMDNELRYSAFRFQIFELPTDIIRRYGENRGASTEVVVKQEQLRKIDNFRERI